MTIPKKLEYQLTPEFTLKVSDLCCKKMKKEPIHKWEQDNNRHVAITGMRAEEGGTRSIIKGCILTDNKGNLKKFHPLLKVDDAWEDEFVSVENIQLCKLYYPPYNFKRTGCRFCPFALTLQEQLETAYKFMPNEAKAGEAIWKPVFDEYRRIGYRLKPYIQMSIDFGEEEDKNERKPIQKTQ